MALELGQKVETDCCLCVHSSVCFVYKDVKSVVLSAIVIEPEKLPVIFEGIARACGLYQPKTMSSICETISRALDNETQQKD